MHLIKYKSQTVTIKDFLKMNYFSLKVNNSLHKLLIFLSTYNFFY